MNKFILFFIALLFIPNVLNAKDIKYPVSTIPKELLEDADAVIRADEIVTEVISINKAVVRVKYAVTVLSKQGDKYHFNVINVGYDKFIKVKYIKAYIYNEYGLETDKLKKSDIFDFAISGGGTMYSDNRMKTATFPIISYPYTIEYEYEYTTDNILMAFHDWFFQSDSKVSVENSKVKIIAPRDFKIKYKENNLLNSVKKSVSNDKDIYVWEETNIPAYEKEELTYSYLETYKYVLLSPVLFDFDGYTGDMSSWKTFGQWIQKLNAGRDVLPEATKSKLKALTAEAESDIEKVKIIYQYLQDNTRYVGIQLGIGGWQPFPAETVDETKYGDCKALSNYMKAMLKAVGIKSYYAVIESGTNKYAIPEDFSSLCFNHATVCVPIENDTIWLECTNQTKPFGYIGSFTNDRKALLINEEGGKLVHTTFYSKEDNQQITNARVVLDESGEGQADITVLHQGLESERDYLIFLLYKDTKEQKKWLYEKTDIPTFDINSFDLSIDKKQIPVVTKKLDLSLRKYASVSGNRLFFKANLMNKKKYVPPELEERKNDICLNTPFTHIDTINYSLPTGYVVEHLPENINYKNEFGEYSATFLEKENTVIYIRKFVNEKGRWSADKYNELRQYYKDIVKADNIKVVLKKS